MFQGNYDRYEITTNRLFKPLRTPYIRIHPKAWHSYIAMRVELYGCRLGKICNQPLGIRSGRIPNSRITASSQWDRYLGPSRSRLYAKRQGHYRGAWVPKFQNRYQYLQVRLRDVVVIVA